MVKTYLILLLSIVAYALNISAQVTSEPSPLQEDSQNVTIFFHADQGNKGLMGLNGSSKIYAHTDGTFTVCVGIHKTVMRDQFRYMLKIGKIES